jgi:hypothetical protein
VEALNEFVTDDARPVREVFFREPLHSDIRLQYLFQSSPSRSSRTYGTAISSKSFLSNTALRAASERSRMRFRSSGSVMRFPSAKWRRT